MKARQVSRNISTSIVNLTFLILITIFIAGCKADEPEKWAGASPKITDKAILELADGCNEFSFDIYQAMKDEYGNLCVSPYSISVGFAMAYAGATGDTETQIAEKLHFTLPQETLHETYHGLNQLLLGRNMKASRKHFILNMANSVWLFCDVLPEYANLMDECYDSEVHDIRNKTPGAAADAINRWVSSKTKGKIENIVTPSSFKGARVLNLVNAVYMDASWFYTFDERETRERDFILLNGDWIQTPTMFAKENYGYMRGEEYKAAEIPYISGDVTMVIFLPDRDRFEEFEAKFDMDLVDETFEKISIHEMELYLPKFEFDSRVDLRKTLTEMGLTLPFYGNDFEATVPGGGIWIEEALHIAYIAVDEKGTVAAAVTSILEEAGMNGRTIVFDIDRPFIFLIRDIPTGAILFIGRVLNPKSTDWDISPSYETPGFSVYPHESEP